LPSAYSVLRNWDWLRHQPEVFLIQGRDEVPVPLFQHTSSLEAVSKPIFAINTVAGNVHTDVSERRSSHAYVPPLIREDS
jgi:hypothetical protein